MENEKNQQLFKHVTECLIFIRPMTGANTA